jgi:hypothetical protein
MPIFGSGENFAEFLFSIGALSVHPSGKRFRAAVSAER